MYYRRSKMRRKSSSHEIVQEIRIAILVAARLHILRTKHVVIRMVLLPLELLALALLLLIPSLLLLARLAFVMALLLKEFFLFGAEIGEFLDAGLVQAVDDGVLADFDEDLFDELLVVEGDLSRGHGAVFLEVGPWCVDDGDVILFVSCTIESASRGLLVFGEGRTVDRVRFC